MPLTDVALRNAKGKSKPYKLTDGGGMFLLVNPNGARYWRLAYRHLGAQKTLALGVYPQVSLADARAKREAARKLIDEGKDPSQTKKEVRRKAVISADNTFELVAREWHENRKDGWTPVHARNVLHRLEADAFPRIGKRPIQEITAPELLEVLRQVEKRGALDIAARLRQTCGAVFRYAIITGRATNDPAANLRGALKTPPKSRHHAALEREDLPEFLGRLAVYDGDPQTRRALHLLVLTFVRTNELIGAKWSEVKFDEAEWRIPAERMKMREGHIVPLSRQALELFREQHEESGRGTYVFPSRKAGVSHMSNNTALFALYRMGYHSRATGHGFRATASTILNEVGFPSDWIERQLAHGERNKIRAAYNRAAYLLQRREMMQYWADFLDDQSRPKPQLQLIADLRSGTE